MVNLVKTSFFFLAFFMTTNLQATIASTSDAMFITENTGKIIVNVSQFPPFVMKEDDGSVVGYDIDLIKEVANYNHWENIEFRSIPRANRFTDLVAGQGDMTIAGITVTADRLKKVDFTLPYFDSGLLILVKPHVESFWENLQNNFKSFLQTMANTVYTFIIFMFFVFGAGAILWAMELGKKENQISDKFFPGIFQAIWSVNAHVTTVGYGDIVAQTWRGRAFMFLMGMFGMAIVGNITGTVSANLIVNRAVSEIQKPSDLIGKPVATIENTSAADFTKTLGTQLVLSASESNAYEALENDQVKAVVYDAPSLLYYINGEGAGKAVTTGSMFDKQYYGIALPKGSRYREDLNRTLIHFKENGVLDNLNQKWFGKSEL